MQTDLMSMLEAPSGASAVVQPPKPVQPSHGQSERLFAAPQTMAGQLNLDTERTPVEYRDNGRTVQLSDPGNAQATVRLNGKCRSCKRPYSVLAGSLKGGGIAVGIDKHGPTTCPDIWRRCDCGGIVPLKPVAGRYVASVPCDARCTNATGHECDCACGGKNHGADHG